MDFYIGKKGENRFTLPSTTFLTHTAVMGASGSGKTVVCKSIVEEAIMAKVPVIAIDPKGDIGGLGIGFGDFSKDQIIIHAEVEAKDIGGSAEDVAQNWIELYKTKLEGSFGEDYTKIEQKFTDSVATILVTPKNAAGLQISLIPSFGKPDNYDELMAESPDAVLSSIDLKIQLLLARSGINASGSTDNRVIFLNNLIRHLWEEENKKLVELAHIIDYIEKPPFEKIGSLSVDKFISKNKRSQIAQGLNALMVRGVPGIDLDFDMLIGLAKKEKKTPIIVFDLRKISDDDEKNTFVAQVLGEVQRWAWSKGGTSRLRALLYFDELYGFMPAGSVLPPSKTALLLLLKQARSAGLGIVVASQNPGDLDYRGLSNIATWILGRLATNQDIAKIQGALKPVFEGAGGTEEEFKALMNKIRALKPGEFVVYNSRVGVVDITTRWLLSLHKGPLTNVEIKALTLRPPEKEKRKTKKKIVKKPNKQKDVPKGVSTIVKKPAVAKKHTERYLKPRINPESPQFLERIYNRISISGNTNIDKFTIELGEKTLFYSPIFYSKTEIKLKRVVKERGLEIPIEIGESMVRTFDLTRSIAWKSIAVEGIHPAGLLPQELELAPLKKFQFIDMKMDLVDKLPENLIWYYSSSPFPEADKLFSKALREFEVKELEKLVGQSKDFVKLNKEIVKLEERIENEKGKIKDYQSRLEFLESEKQAKEAEGRSTKAIDRSIESVEVKSATSEELIKELELKIKTCEEERKKLSKEQEEEYEQFEKDIDFIKAKGTPGDLYKPEKAEIKLLETAIYWVPRVIVPISLKHEDIGGIEVVEETFELNFNLYNGNADLSCHSCGPAVSTDNYYQALLGSEISPPTFVCNVDLKLFCSDHVGFCSNCGKTACIDHVQTCTVGKESICSTCKVLCTSCTTEICPTHAWRCKECGKPYCSNEEFQACTACEEKVCMDDVSQILIHCTTCNNIRCKNLHSLSCDGCHKLFCTDIHLKSCKKCESNVCEDCGRVKAKLKGEEIIARCIVCS